MSSLPYSFLVKYWESRAVQVFLFTLWESSLSLIVRHIVFIFYLIINVDVGTFFS